MDFERDDPQDQTWKKENAKRDGRFDFAAFLGPESLDDRVTHAADGRDVLDKEAFGDFSSVVPKVPFDGQHGRHLAPGDEPEEEEEETGEPADDSWDDEPEEDWVDEGTDDYVPPNDFQDKAPPRPKIIVAEPAPRVYVDPRENGYDADDDVRRGGLSGLQKFLAVLIIIAALAALAMAAVYLLGRGGGNAPGATPTPSPTVPVSGMFDPNDRPTPPPAAPTPVPATPPPAGAVTYTITVSSQGGGSITPSGSVQVEEGQGVSFVIQADPGYEIVQLIYDGKDQTAVSGTYTISSVTADHTLYAVFQAIPETPPPVATPEPTAEPTPEPTAEPTPELTAQPTPTPEPPPAPGIETGPGPAEVPDTGGDVPPVEGMVGDLGPEAGG